MRFRRIFLLIISLICLAGVVFPQTDSSRSVIQVELNEHVGKLIKIHGEYPDNKTSSLTEVGFFWKTQGRLQWHQAYHFPSYGFSVIHAQFGNNEVLGQSIAAIPFMRFEKWKGNTRWAWRAGFGLAWFNKPYDEQDHPFNKVIGSTLTNMTMARVEMSRPLFEKFRYSIGLSFTHCSNSHIAVPNIGANIIAVNAGVSFCSKQNELNKKHISSREISMQAQWKISLHSILGFHEAIGTIRPVDGPRYPVYGVGVFAQRLNGRGRSFLFGINYHYYPYMHDYIISQELFDADDAKKKAQSLVAFIGYEWQFNRFALFIQAGVNVYSPFIQQLNEVWDLPKQGFINLWTSNKLGYRYYLLNEKNKVRPFVHIAVKAIGGTADFFETGIGVAIR